MQDDSDKNTGSPNEDGKTFTQDDVNNIIAERLKKAEASRDKAIQDALAKAKAEWEEANRISSLQGEEKLKAEYQAQLAKIEQEKKELEAKNADTAKRLAIADAQRQLASLGLPTEFAENMLGKDETETAMKIKVFSEAINKKVAEDVNNHLARGAPASNGAPSGTVDQFADLEAAMRRH